MPPTRPAIERWAEKVRPTDPHLCWEWTASVNNNGYGRFGVGPPRRPMVYAHRWAWEYFRGPIPPETPCVLHRCDNPRCVNPWHLWLGTTADNARDMALKGRARPGPAPEINRAKTVCKFGHDYTEANTYTRTRPDGRKQRECRTCMAIRERLRVRVR